MNDVEAPVSGDVADAFPLIPCSASSPWTKAALQCDAFGEAIEAELGRHGIRAYVGRSQPGVYPPYVTMTAWCADEDFNESRSSRRHEMTISIDVNPYLEHPLISTVSVLVRGRMRKWQRWSLTAADVAEITTYALAKAPRPAILQGDRRLALLGMVPVIGHLLVPRNELIERARPKRLTLPTLLAVGGIAVLALVALSPLFAAAGIVALVAAWLLTRRRHLVHSVVKRPEYSPRSLFLVDSWHTSVPDVGTRHAELAARLVARLERIDPEIVRRWETHQYRTAYRVESQRRLTLTKGQAVVHIHIYPMSDQTFVGWDGFLNWACWAETKAVSRTTVANRMIEFRNLTVGGYVPTEFDLVEFNVLSEMVHGLIVAELKMFLREKEIEADLDFAIIRGDRDAALQAGNASRAREGTWRKSNRVAAA